MKKILLFILSFVILGFSMSCKDSGKDPLAYQTGKISAEIAILKNGCRIGAVLNISEEGDIAMTLTSPETVAGTEIKRTGGAVAVTRGELTSSAQEYLAAAELFRLEGDVAAAEPTELNGKKLTKIAVISKETSYEVYLSEDNTPARIVSDGMTVDVIWFERD